MRKALLKLMLTALVPYSAFALERFDILTTEQLEQMLQDRSAGKTDFVLVNSLDEIIYRNLSIPESVNVPWVKAAALAPERLGADKGRLVVTY